MARVSTTGMAVKLALPTLETDPTAFKPMKRRYADRAVAQGRIRGGEGTVQIVEGCALIWTADPASPIGRTAWD